VSAEFLLRCLTAAALIGFATSLVIGALLGRFGTALEQLAPAARARVMLALAVAPAVLAATIEAGWVIRFHLVDAHHGRHDCPVAPAPVLLALAALLLARLGVTTHRVVVAGWRARAAARRLVGLSANDPGDFRVCSLRAPQAFVAGLLRPRIFVSRALLDTIDSEVLATILAHERAHVRRRDPLRRLAASFFLAFHLPGIAGVLERLLARAHESAADAEAASTMGDAPRVAEILVRVARLQIAPAFAGTAAILGSDLESRVRDLLFTTGRSDRPSAAAVTCAFALFFAGAVVFAEPLHTIAELAAALLGG
jgi:Zn-dependent protease with chaperone function